MSLLSRPVINLWLRGQRTFLYLHKNTIEGTEKIEGQTNNTYKLGVNQEQRKVCNTTCMCIPDSRYGLTLAWVTCENSTMLLESDILRLSLAGPYPMLPRFSARCLVLTAPTFFHANLSGRFSPVQLQLPSLLSSHQLSLLGRVVNSRSRQNRLVCFGGLPP